MNGYYIIKVTKNGKPAKDGRRGPLSQAEAIAALDALALEWLRGGYLVKMRPSSRVSAWGPDSGDVLHAEVFATADESEGAND